MAGILPFFARDCPGPSASAEEGSLLATEASPLLAGPLLGEVGPTEARIWAQGFDTSALTLVVEDEDGEVRRVEASPSAEDWLAVTFHVEGLRASVAHSYRLEGRRGRTPDYPLRLAPPPSARATRLAFGSCFHDHQRKSIPLLGAIASEQVDSLVLIGDTTYFDEVDWQSEAAMMLAHLRTRKNPMFAALVRQTPTIAVWDDHDFGPNNADGHFEGKRMALAAFQRMYANAHYGASGILGLFSSVRFGPVEVFLLDSRFHRDAGRRVLLGEAQLDWLVEALAASEAEVKIIASPTQVLPEFPIRVQMEAFRRDAPGELEALLSEIEARGVRGVVFVSGDLHMGQLSRMRGRSLGGSRGPDFWELTTSPLANEPDAFSVIGSDPYVVQEILGQTNYGIVDVDLDRRGEEVRLELRGEAGQAFFTQSIALASLATR